MRANLLVPRFGASLGVPLCLCQSAGGGNDKIKSKAAKAKAESIITVPAFGEIRKRNKSGISHSVFQSHVASGPLA